MWRAIQHLGWGLQSSEALAAAQEEAAAWEGVAPPWAADALPAPEQEMLRTQEETQAAAGVLVQQAGGDGDTIAARARGSSRPAALAAGAAGPRGKGAGGSDLSVCVGLFGHRGMSRRAQQAIDMLQNAGVLQTSSAPPAAPTLAPPPFLRTRAQGRCFAGEGYGGRTERGLPDSNMTSASVTVSCLCRHSAAQHALGHLAAELEELGCNPNAGGNTVLVDVVLRSAPMLVVSTPLRVWLSLSRTTIMVRPGPFGREGCRAPASGEGPRGRGGGRARDVPCGRRSPGCAVRAFTKGL